MAHRDVFDSISPLDYRYWDEDVAHYMSENAFTRYKCNVESSLVKALHEHEQCDEAVLQEIIAACDQITTDEVYAEEARIGHDIRALVNRICAKVSARAKPFVHRMATSFDISDTANAARFKDCALKLLIPKLLELHEVLCKFALREADRIQIGRTHGQHAVPITFGFALTEYVSRLGQCIPKVRETAEDLRGKFSGAVGAYNASSLFFYDPEQFERDVLKHMGLKPGDHATQIVQPEPMMRFLFECIATSGILANLADDMRHLQRSEIAEVGEAMKDDQVGSSTMPQKRNPINFENAKSIWKTIMPRIVTVMMDQISEHQRDLTNSASARTYGEIICYLVGILNRLTKTMGKLTVNAANMERNLNQSGDSIGAEPLYILLAAVGHPDAHEAIRRATKEAHKLQQGLYATVTKDEELVPYLAKISPESLAQVQDPKKYCGIAAKIVRDRVINWMFVLNHKK